MKNMDDFMTVLYKQKWKINILEEIDITKAASSLNLLNDIINPRNDPVYRNLYSVDRC